MAEWRPLQLGDRSYRPRSGSTSIERMVNLYAEPNPPEAKNPVTLYGVPGLSLWATAGSGPCRGLHTAADNTAWTVSGNELYAISAAGVASLIGSIAGTHQCRMIDNRSHVMIATENELYYANASGVWHLATVSGIAGLAYQDGYGLLTRSGGQEFYVTEPDDLTVIDPISTTADASPDNNVGLIVDQREAWVFKERTTEIYQNTGDATFPFQRVGFIERGAAGSGAITRADALVYWIGEDGRAYRAAGYHPEPISTPDIERLLAGASSLASVEAFAFTFAGHTFVHFGFSDLTLLYNATTGRWSERLSFGLDRWRAQRYTRLLHRQLVGDYANGNIYELSSDVYTENGAALERTLYSPPLHSEPVGHIVHELRLDIEAGVGLTSGQGSDPLVLMSFSDDDGRTWSTEIEGSIGAIGVYRKRVSWQRLGRAHSRVFRFRVSDPVKLAILGASWRGEALAA